MTIPEQAIGSKQCTRCERVKPLDQFPQYTKRSGKLHIWARCTECTRAYYRSPERREKANKNFDRYRAEGRYLEKQKRAARVRAEKYPEKLKAGRIFKQAIKMGRIIRPDQCERCGAKPEPKRNGASRIQGHHHDYSKPLVVEWLCEPCHIAEHLKDKQ